MSVPPEVQGLRRAGHSWRVSMLRFEVRTCSIRLDPVLADERFSSHNRFNIISRIVALLDNMAIYGRIWWIDAMIE
jgi:hypothetical protein